MSTQEDFIPCNEADLVTGEEFPAIDRLMTARGYIGHRYIGRDPLTDALYYKLPETNLKYAFVPSLKDVIRIN